MAGWQRIHAITAHRNRSGIFCVGCCWSLMLLMFVVGAGSLIWGSYSALLWRWKRTCPGPPADRFDRNHSPHWFGRNPGAWPQRLSQYVAFISIGFLSFMKAISEQFQTAMLRFNTMSAFVSVIGAGACSTNLIRTVPSRSGLSCSENESSSETSAEPSLDWSFAAPFDACLSPAFSPGLGFLSAMSS